MARKCGKGLAWNEKAGKCVATSRVKAKSELRSEDSEFMSKKGYSKASKKGSKYGSVIGGSLAAGYVRGKTKGRGYSDQTTFEGGAVGTKKVRKRRPTTRAGDIAATGAGALVGGYAGAAAGYGAKRLKEEYRIQKRAKKIRKKRSR